MNTRTKLYARNAQRNFRGGFSLIELLLVLVILATLTAIIAPRFTSRSKQARVTAAKTDISRLELLLDSFEIDTGRLPTSDEGLDALLEEPSNVTNWQGPYLKKNALPKDPWGNEYVYEYPGKNNTSSYDLSSHGPDGKQGGDDDVTNWSEDK
ncbi:MAG: type II secretion system major pseudopilin GspG [Phycisphaeraceae bacterium JB051]